MFLKCQLGKVTLAIPLIVSAITSTWYLSDVIATLEANAVCNNKGMEWEKRVQITKLEKIEEKYALISYKDRFGNEQTKVMFLN